MVDSLIHLMIVVTSLLLSQQQVTHDLVDGTVGFSASYDIGNGFTGAFGYNGQGSVNNAGLGTEEGLRLLWWSAYIHC